MKWPMEKLGLVCDHDSGKIQTGPFGSQLHEYDYTIDGVPVIMPKDINDGRVNIKTVARISEQKAAELMRHMVSVGAIIMPRRGELGKRAFITDNENGFLCGTGCIKIELKGTRLYPKFLYYYLDQPEIIEWIERKATGTTMLNLNTGIIRDIPIPLMSLELQKCIANILSTYDDLIENNNCRIALLDKAARLLYEEWFVRLRFPGHEHTKMVDGVPEGWEKVMAADVLDVLSGGTPKTTTMDYWNGEIPFFTPKDATSHFYVFETEKAVTEKGLKNCNSRLYPKDTIFITARGTVGKLNLAQRSMAMNQSCYALVAKKALSHYFIYCALQSSIEEFKARAAGAVFDAIIVDTFKLIPFLLPSRGIIQRFHDEISTIFHQVEILMKQNQKLKQARDLLLPKLMSGEVSV